jgi:glycosyltransferase involved in cell wall biosynthesis
MTASMITLALPAYNEQDNIAVVLGDAVKSLQALNRPWEIIVIDNASSDATADRVRDFAARQPEVRLVVHDTNKLYSGSCATALREAKGEQIAIMDSDRQHTADDLPRFLGKVDQGADLVIGWRRHRNDPLARILFSSVFNTMGKIYLQYPLHDLNCGFRVVTRRLADRISITHRINLANPEFYTRAVLAGAKVDEVEVNHFARKEGKSTMDFGKIFRLFMTVNDYFRSLHADLRKKA